MQRDVVKYATGQRLPGSRQGEQLVPIDRAAGRVTALQRRVGNRAVARLVQREVTRDPPGTWITPGAQARAAAEVERRLAEQTQRLKDLERVGEDIIGEDLGLSIRPSPREPPAGGAPVSQRGVPSEWERPLEERLAEAAAGDGPEAEEASRLLRERRINKRWIEKRLKEIADEGGRHSEEAEGLLRELREADKERGRLKRILKPKQPGAGAANTPKTMAYETQGSAADAERTAAKGEPAAVNAGAVQEHKVTSPGAAGKTATQVEGAAANGGENLAAKEVEKVAANEAEKLGGQSGRLWTRLAGSFGIEVLEALVPSPLDAIELMIDFFGSFAEAREAIRARNLRSGVAIGLAAYLVVPRWEWAKQFAHTAVSRDVTTEILGAAGVAENAFNEGLVRGFLFGERHSKEQADRLRQKAFDIVLEQGRSVGRYVDDDVWSFDPEDVYTFASALIPVVDWFLAEAERTRNERLEHERERAFAKRYSKGPSPGEPKY